MILNIIYSLALLIGAFGLVVWSIRMERRLDRLDELRRMMEAPLRRPDIPD